MASKSKKKPGQSKPAIDDAALLETAFQDVTPMPGKKVGKKIGKTPKTEPKAKKPAPARPVKTPAPSQPKPQPLPELGHGAAPGVDKRTAQRLRRGRLDVEARLDLHGFTQSQAHPALDNFLGNAQQSGKRCVLVVTGKGTRQIDEDTGLDRATGVLKDQVPRWLNQPPNRGRILSFTHATQADGGSGALYILLKKGQSNKGGRK
jgi:DNA-nicking Smr family endonuclease